MKLILAVSIFFGSVAFALTSIDPTKLVISCKKDQAANLFDKNKACYLFVRTEIHPVGQQHYYYFQRGLVNVFNAPNETAGEGIVPWVKIRVQTTVNYDYLDSDLHEKLGAALAPEKPLTLWIDLDLVKKINELYKIKFAGDHEAEVHDIIPLIMKYQSR